MMFRRFAATLALLSIFSLTAPLQAAPALLAPPQKAEIVPGRPGGVKTISSVALPKTWNAYLAAETSSTDIIGQMYLGLVTTNPITAAIEPSLAESWTISPDHKTYTFKLRPGLKWSDGKPLTADDVVFTYKEIIDNENIPNNYRDGLLVPTAGGDVFPDIQKIDELTVAFTTPRPFVPFLRGLSDPILPRHVFADKVRPDASGELPYNHMWGLDTPLEQIVVNGPWKLGQYRAGERVELVPNPHYYLKDAQGARLPYLDKLVTLELADQDEEVAAFNAGITDALSLRAPDLARITRADAKVYNLGPATGTLFVMFNQSQALREDAKPVVDPVKSAWFRNKLFRQALAHGIDKAGMIRDLYQGLALPQHSQISQTSEFYNPAVRQYPYDLAKAAALLQQAGFRKNAKGQLLDAGGHHVAFRLLTNVGNPQREGACKMLQRDWGKLGIQVQFVAEQFMFMVERIDQTLDWDAMMIGLTGSAIEPHGGINSWKLDGRMHMWNMGNPVEWQGRRGTSYEQWEKDVYQLYEQAAVEFDPARRKALYQKSQAIVADNLPFLFTVNTLALVAINERFGNVFPNINGGSALNTVNWNTDFQYVRP